MQETINVYNKNGELLAVFKDWEAKESQTSKYNTLVSPSVHIVLNGESTFTFSIMAKSTKWKDVSHVENEWHVANRVYKLYNKDSIKQTGEILTVTLSELWYELGKEYAQIFNVDTTVEALDEHTIKILPKSESGLPYVINGTYYSDNDVLDSRGVLLPKGSAGYALWGLIKANRSGWKIGIVDVIEDGFNPSEDFGVFNFESDMQSILENIKNVQTLWGGYLLFDSKNKIIHLRDETKDTDFNKYKGYDVVYGKNMFELPTITIDNDIITKAYILGNGNLNIKAVNGGRTYIENYSFTNEVYEGYLQNPNIHYTGDLSTSGQTQLLNWGIKELEKMCKPREQSSVSIVDRRADENYSHEVFDLADIIRVSYPVYQSELNVLKEQRVIEITFNPLNRLDTQAVIGEKVLNDRDIFQLIYRQSLLDTPKIDWEGFFSGFDININFEDLYGDLVKEDLNTLFKKTSDVLNATVEITDENVTSIAELNLFADNTKSELELLSQFKTATSNAIASINLTTNGLQSQINSNVSYTNQNSQSIANINQTVNSMQSTISLQAQYINTNSNNIASISLKADANSSSIRLKADTTYVDGLLKATNAEIDNLKSDMITANWVDANFVSATGGAMYGGTLYGTNGEFSGNLTATITQARQIYCTILNCSGFQINYVAYSERVINYTDANGNSASMVVLGRT